MQQSGRDKAQVHLRFAVENLGSEYLEKVYIGAVLWSMYPITPYTIPSSILDQVEIVEKERAGELPQVVHTTNTGGMINLLPMQTAERRVTITKLPIGNQMRGTPVECEISVYVIGEGQMPQWHQLFLRYRTGWGQSYSMPATDFKFQDCCDQKPKVSYKQV